MRVLLRRVIQNIRTPTKITTATVQAIIKDAEAEANPTAAE